MEPQRPRIDSTSLFLDDGTVERVLSGDALPDTVTEPYRAVVQLLSDVRATSVDAENEEAAISAIMASASRPATELRRRNHRSIGLRVAGISAGVVFALSGTAAAATGSLPEPAQRAVASTVAHAGIDIPKPNDDKGASQRSIHPVVKASTPSTSATTDASTTSSTEPTTPTSTTPDDKGHGKPEEPTKTGQEHQSATGAEHSKGAENSEKPKSNAKSRSDDGEDSSHGKSNRGSNSGSNGKSNGDSSSEDESEHDEIDD